VFDQRAKQRFRARRVEPKIFAQLFNGDPRFLARPTRDAGERACRPASEGRRLEAEL